MGFCSALHLGLGEGALGAHPAVAVVGGSGATSGAGAPRVSHPGLNCIMEFGNLWQFYLPSPASPSLPTLGVTT